jgi:hypothetical protein
MHGFKEQDAVNGKVADSRVMAGTQYPWAAVTKLEGSVVKSYHVERPKPPRKTTASAKGRPGALFIGTRPRKVRMTLRGQVVDVEVIPVVGTTTHVNLQLTISRKGKVLDWAPTRAELERIGCTLGTHAELETSH